MGKTSKRSRSRDRKKRSSPDDRKHRSRRDRSPNDKKRKKYSSSKSSSDLLSDSSPKAARRGRKASNLWKVEWYAIISSKIIFNKKIKLLEKFEEISESRQRRWHWTKRKRNSETFYNRQYKLKRYSKRYIEFRGKWF